MGAAYSQDLRDRVLAAYDRGMMTKQIADLFQISRAWARRVKQRRRETGQRTSRPMGGLRVMKVDLERLRELIAQRPDATTKELHQLLQSEGIGCGESAIGMAMQRLGLSFKKRRSMPPSRIVRISRSVGRGGRLSRRREKPNV